MNTQVRWSTEAKSKTASPQLLVSVRSVSEAIHALEGGAAILDVKEPSRGSLGMASLDQITAIAGIDRVRSGAIPLSVALGEVIDWHNFEDIPAMPLGISFAKLGLHGCGSKSAWQSDWMRLRGEIQRKSLSQLHWVAVAYADADDAGAPPIATIVSAAIESSCAGLLIDTWTKDGRTLLDLLDRESLTAIANDCHSSGLFFAIAGKLSRESLSSLSRVSADVVAVRSAACKEKDRTAELDSAMVAEFRKALFEAFVSD